MSDRHEMQNLKDHGNPHQMRQRAMVFVIMEVDLASKFVLSTVAPSSRDITSLHTLLLKCNWAP